MQYKNKHLEITNLFGCNRKKHKHFLINTIAKYYLAYLMCIVLNMFMEYAIGKRKTIGLHFHSVWAQMVMFVIFKRCFDINKPRSKYFTNVVLRPFCHTLAAVLHLPFSFPPTLPTNIQPANKHAKERNDTKPIHQKRQP